MAMTSRANGKVKWFHTEKGYGWIVPSDGRVVTYSFTTPT
jgi:cold shock CspA family protein